jgi:hypothetical protein
MRGIDILQYYILSALEDLKTKDRRDRLYIIYGYPDCNLSTMPIPSRNKPGSRINAQLGHARVEHQGPTGPIFDQHTPKASQAHRERPLSC